MKDKDNAPVLRAALAGCGWFGLRSHLPALQKLSKRGGGGYKVELVGCLARSEEGRKRLRKKLGKSCSEFTLYESLDTLLADPTIDVVDLVLPIPCMADAIQRCLAANKCVLSEKPIAHDLRAACALWRSYCSRSADDASGCWCVLENWSHKPGVSQVSRLLAEGAVGKVVGYQVAILQDLPGPHQMGWRACASESYDGGWVLDVGVHVVRAVRMWFGEICAARCLQWNEQSVHTHTHNDQEGAGGPARRDSQERNDVPQDDGRASTTAAASETSATSVSGPDMSMTGELGHLLMKGEFVHEEGGLVGSMRVEFKNTSPTSGVDPTSADTQSTYDAAPTTDAAATIAPPGGLREPVAMAHGVRVWGDAGRVLEWGFGSEFVRVVGVDDGGVMNVIRLEGDGWVSGGVREVLWDGLTECALRRGLLREGPGMSVHRCSPEEGLRDAAAVWAIHHSRHTGGALVQVSDVLKDETLTEDGSGVPGDVGRRGGGEEERERGGNAREGCIWKVQPCGSTVFDASGTRLFKPWKVIRCFSHNGLMEALSFWGCSLRNGRGHPRAVGADHSWSVCTQGLGLRVEMRHMGRLLDVRGLREGEREQLGGSTCVAAVRVQAGCSLRALSSAIRVRGLSLVSLPVLQDQTVAGAISTGSHGSSLRYGTLSDSVLAMRMVMFSGDEVLLEGGGLQARGARMSFGLLGIITEVELGVCKAYSVVKEVRPLSWDELAAASSPSCALLASAEHVWCHMRLGSPQLGVAVHLHRAQPGVEVHLHRASQYEDVSTQGGGKLKQEQFVHNQSRPELYDGSNWFPHPEPPVLSSDVSAGAPKAESGPWVSMQYSVELSRMQEVVAVLLALGKDASMRGRIVELKFLGARRGTLMGPNAPRVGAGEEGVDVVCCNLFWKSGEGEQEIVVRECMGLFERHFQSMGGVPHWGKLHMLPDGYIQGVLAHAEEFYSLVAECSR